MESGRPLTGGLHDALEDDHNFKLLIHEGALRQVEEGAFGIDLVADGEWRHQEELVGARPEAHVQLALVQRQKLALRSLTRLERKQGDGRIEHRQTHSSFPFICLSCMALLPK